MSKDNQKKNIIFFCISVNNKNTTKKGWKNNIKIFEGPASFSFLSLFVLRVSGWRIRLAVVFTQQNSLMVLVSFSAKEIFNLQRDELVVFEFRVFHNFKFFYFASLFTFKT